MRIEGYKMASAEKFKSAAIKAKDFTVENIGKRGILLIVLIIGIIILAIGLVSINLNSMKLQDLNQKDNLGLLDSSTIEWQFLYTQIYKDIASNAIIVQVGALISAIALIIAAISPISGKGTPYFSEYVRLGLIVFAAVMIYIAVLA